MKQDRQNRTVFRKPLRQQLSESASALDHYAKLHGVTDTGAAHIAEIRSEVDGLEAKHAARKPREATGKPLERDVQRDIIKYLLAHPAVILVERINSGAVYGAEGNFVRFHHLMLPSRFKAVRMLVADLSVTLSDGRRMVIECKRADWRGPSDDREREQAAYLAHIRAHGGVGIFATSVDDVDVALGAVTKVVDTC